MKIKKQQVPQLNFHFKKMVNYIVYLKDVHLLKFLNMKNLLNVVWVINLVLKINKLLLIYWLHNYLMEV